MHKKMKTNALPRFFALSALCLALYAGCAGGLPVIPEDLSVLQFFQRAQEEFEYSNWDNALYYYHTFIERHPDDLPHVTEARYEIAFIHYKQKKYEEAAKDFRELLDFYDTTDLPLAFPLWPRVLSQRVLQIMKDGGFLPKEDLTAEE